MEDGETTVEGVSGALGVFGVLEGDSVQLTYDGFRAWLLDNALGEDVPAAVEFYGLRLDNANYACLRRALHLPRAQHPRPSRLSGHPQRDL